MKMKTKTFDAVAVKRRGAQRIYQETHLLTEDERRSYWEAANRQLQAHIDQLRQPTQPQRTM